MLSAHREVLVAKFPVGDWHWQRVTFHFSLTYRRRRARLPLFVRRYWQHLAGIALDPQLVWNELE